MAKSTIATLLLLFLAFHVAASTSITTEEDSKPEVSTETLPTTTAPFTHQALEASFVPLHVGLIHPVHVRLFRTHRPIRLFRNDDVVVGYGGRRMGMGFRLHPGHGVRCGFMKRMMGLGVEDGGEFPMMHHHHHHHRFHHVDRRGAGQQKKEEGGRLKKWIKEFVGTDLI